MSDWTPERHTAAKQRCAAVSPGPWHSAHVYAWPNAEGTDIQDAPYAGSEVLVEGAGILRLETADNKSGLLRSGDADFIAHAPEDLPDALAKIDALQQALRYAVAIIESYQMDLRNSDNPAFGIGMNLAEHGFCQGVIYTDAQRTIQRLAAGELTFYVTSDTDQTA